MPFRPVVSPLHTVIEAEPNGGFLRPPKRPGNRPGSLAPVTAPLSRNTAVIAGFSNDPGNDIGSTDYKGVGAFSVGNMIPVVIGGAVGFLIGNIKGAALGAGAGLLMGLSFD